MPRTYTPCRDGQNRYATKTWKGGRSLEMCQQLSALDTGPKAGRTTRCFDPEKESNRKTCTVLVPHSFKTIAPPSFWSGGELQRMEIGWTCPEINHYIGGPFEGQGEDFTSEHSTDHIVVGPIKVGGIWQVNCVYSPSLLLHNSPMPGPFDTFNRMETRHALGLIGYVPDRDQAEAIIARWDNERKWLCPSSQENMNIASAFVRGLIGYHMSSDDLCEDLRTVVSSHFGIVRCILS